MKQSVIYSLSMILVIIPVFNLKMLKWLFIISIAHFLIRLINLFMKEKIMKNEKSSVIAYLVNQIIQMIGVLERCIILLMLSVGQYAAIGFVLTAKSIARYNKIGEDARFSEYYLLGTLLSTLLVIGMYLIIVRL